ncbi:hypothetical protein KI387_018961, partial [Taxus chinensis]
VVGVTGFILTKLDGTARDESYELMVLHYVVTLKIWLTYSIFSFLPKIVNKPTSNDPIPSPQGGNKPQITIAITTIK